MIWFHLRHRMTRLSPAPTGKREDPDAQAIDIDEIRQPLADGAQLVDCWDHH
jgi:hypothetical protein